MTCGVCDLPSEQPFCGDCARVREMVAGYRPYELVLIVDGAFNDITREAGVGLVLAREADEVVLATGAVSLHTAKNSVRVESQAILRGSRWAPGLTIWSDCTSSIRSFNNRPEEERGGGKARFIPDELRDPLHNLAHRLANVGLRQDWERYERLWIPGEVW